MLVNIEKAISRSILNSNDKASVLHFMKIHKKELGVRYPINSYHFYNDIANNPLKKLNNRLTLSKAAKAFKQQFDEESESIKEMLTFYKIYRQNPSLLKKIIDFNIKKAGNNRNNENPNFLVIEKIKRQLKKSFSVFYKHYLKKEKFLIKANKENQEIYCLRHFCNYPDIEKNKRNHSDEYYIVIDFKKPITINTISLFTLSKEDGIDEFHNWLNGNLNNQLEQLKNIDLSFLKNYLIDINLTTLITFYYIADPKDNKNKAFFIYNISVITIPSFLKKNV
jgi:hypothetical protein